MEWAGLIFFFFSLSRLVSHSGVFLPCAAASRSSVEKEYERTEAGEVDRWRFPQFFYAAARMHRHAVFQSLGCGLTVPRPSSRLSCSFSFFFFCIPALKKKKRSLQWCCFCFIAFSISPSAFLHVFLVWFWFRFSFFFFVCVFTTTYAPHHSPFRSIKKKLLFFFEFVSLVRV